MNRRPNNFGKQMTRRLALGALVLMAGNFVSAGEVVLLLKSRDVPQYAEAARGFVEKWKAQNSEVEVLQRTLPANAADTTLDSFSARTPLAVVAVGTEATRWAIKNTAGPVVFCMVANPQTTVMAGLGEEDRRRVAGVSLNVPVKKQFLLVRELMPKVRKIGVIFDPEKSSGTVEEARLVADELGLELITQEVAGESALPGAVDLIASRIDLLWAPVDGTVFNSRNAQFVLSEMLRRKIPVMGFSENMVKAGALLAPRVSYASLGRQTADLLHTALQANPSPGGTIQQPANFDFVVNGRVCELLGRPIKPSSVTATYSLQHED